jgi:hypothetical protein
MADVPDNGQRWKIDNLDKRVTKIEDTNILVLADRVLRLTGLVTWMIATMATFILTILGGVIIFLVTKGGP